MLTLLDRLPLTRPLLGVDLEATDNEPRSARICEVAFELFYPPTPNQPARVKEYRTLVNPGTPIPLVVTEIHGINDAMVADAPTFESLVDNFLKGFSGCDFIGYNVVWDLRLLTAEIRRTGRTFAGFDDAHIIDPFRIWQQVEGRTLSHAVERWLRGSTTVNDAEIEQQLSVEEGRDKAHGALWDIKMTTRILAAQLEAVPSLPRDVKELSVMCAGDRFDLEGSLRWKDDQLTLNIGKYRGKPLADVAKRDKGYLKWILKEDFSDKVKGAVQSALDNKLEQRRKAPWAQSSATE